VCSGTSSFTTTLQQLCVYISRSVIGYRGKVGEFARMGRCSNSWMGGAASELLVMRLRSYDGPVRRRSWVGAEPGQSGR
jgi:hypothetical protein